MPEEKPKPVADEQTLGRLLEAAFVLQEHSREMRRQQPKLGLTPEPEESEDFAYPKQNPAPPPEPPVPWPDNTSTLAKIAETQHQIQVRRLEFGSALKLVAQRVRRMTNAAGAAIGIIEGLNVRYRAVAGQSTPAKDSIITLDRSVLGLCLKTGQAFWCADTSTEILLDADECERKHIHSFIAVPVCHDGRIAGGLELYYPSPDAFTEQELHTCQLMAGLVAEALGREEEAKRKKSLAGERARMMEALEKLQENPAVLEKPLPRKPTPAEPPRASATYFCRKCGHPHVAEEQFCGQCGSPRASDYEPPNMQSKLASLWQKQEWQKKVPGAESPKNALARVPTRLESSRARTLEQQIPELFRSDVLEFIEKDEAAAKPFGVQPMSDPQEPAAATEGLAGEITDSSYALVKPEVRQPALGSSAASARAFLEKLSSRRRSGAILEFWNQHRGDIYLGLAVILVLCIMRWGIWSDHSDKAAASPTRAGAARRQPAPDADLSLFDRMLIQLGLAEAPEPTPDKGNPGAKVWVDLRTGLYYCPGTDPYGKTPKGKYSTQKEAQLDQFEPAYRKACN